MNRQATTDRFTDVWRRVSNGADGAQIGLDLCNRYADPARRYHTLDHINFCLQMFDQVGGICADPDAVELAIWFHDVVYDFPVDNNERQSAKYFMDMADGKLADALRERIFNLIIVTDHRTTAVGSDQQTLVDIDLSSFGLPWDRFVEDGVNVRQEMDSLEDEEFYRNQITFMRQLLGRERFYFTPWFQEKFGPTARNNLERYLQLLSQEGYSIS